MATLLEECDVSLPDNVSVATKDTMRSRSTMQQQSSRGSHRYNQDESAVSYVSHNTICSSDKFVALKDFLQSKKDTPRFQSIDGDHMKTYGDSSRFLNECNNMFAKVNGGTIAGVLQNQYHKDYMV